MKKITYLFVLTAIIYACKSEPHFVLKGNITDSDSVTFLLQIREAGRIVTLDSAFSKKGTFRMTGSIEYPDLVQLVALNTPYRTSMWLENSDITITGTLDSLFDAKITGSKTQDEYMSYIKSIKPLSERYSKLVEDYQAARQARDQAKASEIQEAFSTLETEILDLQKAFIKNNPSSYVTPSFLRSLSIDMDAAEIEEIINAMDTNVARVPIIKELRIKLEAMKAVSIGQKAPDFTLNDVNGNPVSLSSKLGPKLLLVDFWAAWCGPCRQENPNVVKVYNEFKKKGFDVFGVSLDQSKDEWVKAIADDKLAWTHVSDLQYFNNTAAKMYAVDAIPANFLLDETGTIIGRNLRGQDLYNKVAEVLGK